MSKHHALEASLAKAKSKLKRLKQEAKDGTEKIERVEKERDKAKQEAKVPRLAAMATSEAKVRVEDNLAWVRDALAAAEEDGHGLERTSLLLDLEASRDEVFDLHSQTGKDKEAMVEDYQKALEQIFPYDYKYCVFKHGICGDRPRIPDDMPDSANPLPLEFFANLGCPPCVNSRRNQGCQGTSG